MENSYTIKESLIYNTLYVQTVPQYIYQHKSFSSFWAPDFEVNSKWTLSLNPKLNNPKQSRMNKLNTKYSNIEFQHKRFRLLNGEIILKMPLWKIYKSLFQKSWQERMLPQQWKTAKVKFLRKPGKANYHNPSSYRPISLTSVLGKCMERIIVTRLYSYM